MRCLATVVLLLATSTPVLGQHSLGARQQWQPMTESDPRLQQSVEIEILGRAAVPALAILSDCTGVSLGVAPEDLDTVGERKLSIFAHGCTLKDIMAQIPDALQECHWDIDESSDPPVYLLHRNASAEHVIATLAGRDTRDARAGRRGRVETARRALRMSAGELAELEKADIFLARTVQEPQARAALEAFLSLRAAQMDELLSTGSATLKYSDASPQLQKALERFITQTVAYLESEGETCRPEAEWRPALQDTTITFWYDGRGEDADRGSVEVNFFLPLDDPQSFSSLGGHVVPPKHPHGRYAGPIEGPRPPRGGRGGIGAPGRQGGMPVAPLPLTPLHRLLLATGTPDLEEADRILRGSIQEGMEATVEHEEEKRQREFRYRDDPDLQQMMAVGRDTPWPRSDFAEFEQEVAAVTGMSVISDYFTGSTGTIPMEIRAQSEVSLWQLLYATAEHHQYVWKKAGRCLVFHHSKWYQLAPSELPESVLFRYVRRYQEAELTFDDVVDLVASTGEDRLRHTALPMWVRGSFHYPSRWALLLYASLTLKQRDQVRAPEGLRVADMTQEQREGVLALALNPELILPHSRADFAAAVFRIEESQERRGGGDEEWVRDHVKLFLEFPDGTREGGTVRLPRSRFEVSYAPLVHAETPD